MKPTHEPPEDSFSQKHFKEHPGFLSTDFIYASQADSNLPPAEVPSKSGYGFTQSIASHYGSLADFLSKQSVLYTQKFSTVLMH